MHAVSQQQQPFHAHPYNAHDHVQGNGNVNGHGTGSYQSSRSLPSAHSDNHYLGNGMPQYQHAYPGGYGAPPERHFAANQLPPLFNSMEPSLVPASMPGSMGQSQGMYTAGGMPTPTPMSLPSSSTRTLEKPAPSYHGDDGRYRYSLKVEQEPVRARMCGFGDKDRRPITPPPCVQLIITDARTNEPVSCDQIDGGFFVLQVDLWDAQGVHEQNVVRAASSSPAGSISTATITSYPPEPERHLQMEMSSRHLHTSGSQHGFGTPAGHPQALAHPSMHGHHMGDPFGQQQQQQHHQQYQSGMAANPFPGMAAQMSQPQQNNMTVRNLIGSTSVNASRLRDHDKKEGFWFVLQDLSVRTEGFFRLKMVFFNVVHPSGNGTNKGKAPALAYVFSDKFQVFSAKKFPGVLESTELSKTFASQGIKIPIRKELKGGDDRDEDDDDNEK